ncbi:MAG: ABC transporter permease subunit [Desulfovibrionales bacterium]|nr:ABC transporter permease subunit [Desulfovibrionales bacterium]
MTFSLQKKLCVLVVCAFLAIFFLYPIAQIFWAALHNEQGQLGLDLFTQYFSNTALHAAFLHSLGIAFAVTIITTALAFLLAFAKHQLLPFGSKCIPLIAMLPLFAPSLFPAMGLQYLLGNKGVFRALLFGNSLYGTIGLIIAFTIYTLPHAYLLLQTSFSNIPAKLYFSAQSMGASSYRQFFTVTLPHIRYGLVSAASSVFILTFTDFGIPKIIGGNVSMLATEIYSQVVGLQNFSMGSAISILLMVPSIGIFALDWYMQKKQRTKLSTDASFAVALPLHSKALVTILVWGILGSLIAVIGSVVAGSFFTYWPYNLTPTLRHYDFSVIGLSLAPFGNSLLLATGTAFLGSLSIFFITYTVQRMLQKNTLQKSLGFLCVIPLSVPGTVLGIAYLFAFNTTVLANSLLLQILNTIMHFFTVAYLSYSVALSKLPASYEKVGRSMGVSPLATCKRVILPMQIDVIADVFFYLFLNALITISALIFLYTPDTLPAAIAILHMEESGYIASASAMGTLLLLTALLSKVVHSFCKRCIIQRTR